MNSKQKFNEKVLFSEKGGENRQDHLLKVDSSNTVF